MSFLRDNAARLLLLASIVGAFGVLVAAQTRLMDLRAELRGTTSELERKKLELEELSRSVEAWRRREAEAKQTAQALENDLRQAELAYEELHSGSDELLKRLESRNITHVSEVIKGLRALVGRNPVKPTSLPTWLLERIPAYVSRSSTDVEAFFALTDADPAASLVITQGLLVRAQGTKDASAWSAAAAAADRAVGLTSGSALLDARVLRSQIKTGLAQLSAVTERDRLLDEALADLKAVAMEDRNTQRGFDAFATAVATTKRRFGLGEAALALACDEALINGVPHRQNICALNLWDASGAAMTKKDKLLAVEYACRAAKHFDPSTYPAGDPRHEGLANALERSKERCRKLRQ